MSNANLPEAPHGVVQAIEGLDALARLLQCADKQAWASQGRPTSRGLAALAFMVHGELCASLGEVMAISPQVTQLAA